MSGSRCADGPSRHRGGLAGRGGAFGGDRPLLRLDRASPQGRRAGLLLRDVEADSHGTGGVKRGVPHIYVSAWPKDGIRTEFSVKGGYRFKKNTAVQVTIGTATFQLFARNDRAFVRNPTEELKLIEAMKKGSRMTVKGVSEQGTGTTDSYSLIGLSQALQELASGCRKT